MKRLLRSAYLDTNVFVAAYGRGPQAAPSGAVVALLTSGRLAGVGSLLLRKEIRQACSQLGIHGPPFDYPEAIVVEIGAGRELARPSRLYRTSLGIKAADARHLAFAVTGRVDVLVSWNREDLVRPSTIRNLARVNSTLGLSTPLLATPARLLAETERGSGRGRLVWG